MGGEYLDVQGGAHRADTVYTVVEVYDIATDSWSTKKDLPFHGMGIHTNVIGDKIFAISGYALFMYNPVTDKWAQKANVPFPKDLNIIASTAPIYPAFSVEVDNNKIMLYFGYTSSDVGPWWEAVGAKMAVAIYNTQTNMWSEGEGIDPNISRVRGCCVTTGFYAPKKSML